MQHEETDVKTNKHAVLACLIAAVCRNGSSHGQGGSRLHHRRPNWLLPQPNGLLIPPDRGSSPLFRVCPAGSWEQLSFPRVLINPAPPCISYNKQSKLNRLVYEDSRQLGWPRQVGGAPGSQAGEHMCAFGGTAGNFDFQVEKVGCLTRIQFDLFLLSCKETSGDDALPITGGWIIAIRRAGPKLHLAMKSL